MDTNQKPQTIPEPSGSNSTKPDNWCTYNKVKSHDSKECKTLYEHFLLSIVSGKLEVKSPKQKPKNNKSWSKNKDKKAQKCQGKAPKNEARADLPKPKRRMTRPLTKSSQEIDDELKPS